ncbi:MAG: lysylphosphatidylglycerol synthase domain-containing protein [Rhodospirillales bacterium]
MTKSRNRQALKVGSGLAALAGLALIVVLIAYQGFAELGRVLFSAGWGIAAVTVFHLVPMAASAIAWRAAAGSAWQGGVAVFMWARLVREAVNGLLPVAQIGGDVVGARVLSFHGARARIAGASVIVDLTLEFLTQIVFTVLGLGLLLLHGGGEAVNWVLIGLAVAVPAAAGFLLAQRWGLFKLLERLLERLAAHFDWPALRSLANLHETILALYRHRRAMVEANLWHMVSWLLGAVEVWLTLVFLGADTTFGEALIIESLGQAIRSAAFLVPGALGIQEGGYLFLGVLFGLSPEAALSVSLIKRIRELVLGVPAMLAWQGIEGRRLLAASNGDKNGEG